MRLEGKAALITGAAHGLDGVVMGFGGAAARIFAREGASVLVTDIDDQLGEQTVQQILDEGGTAAFLHHDVTDERQWADTVRGAVKQFDKLDILVNNAGTASRTKVDDTTVEEFDSQMAIHARGCFLGMRAAIPEMRKAGGGSIVNVGSVYSIIGSKSSTAYHAAKGAIVPLTKSAAVQYARENIRVNAVHPGFAVTPMTLGEYPDIHHLSPDERVRIPMQRLCTADEIAYGMLFLASDESSFVTGADLVIDGGMAAL